MKLTSRDVSKILNVSRNTITKWIEEKILIGEQDGDYNTAPWKFAPDHIEEVRLARIKLLELQIKDIEKEIKLISTPTQKYIEDRYGKTN